jgi:hypothetical protein
LLLALGCAARIAPAQTAPLDQAAATVNGQVISLDNVPLGGVRLAAYTQPSTTTDRQAVATTQTDAAGRYTLQVPAGRIWIGVATQDIGQESIWGYDNNPVDVTAGAAISAVDFRVAIRVLPTAQPTFTLVAGPPGVPTPVPPLPSPAANPTEIPAPQPPGGMPTTGGAAPLPWGAGLLLGLALLVVGAGLRRGWPGRAR